MEPVTGRVLYARHPDRLAYPASMTKMMTLYMLFEAVDEGRFSMDSKLTVSRRASGMPPSRLGLRPGQTITVKDAILSLVTKSANDVAVVIAEAISGTEWEFAKAMTSKARYLGMSNTTFRNASGLPDNRQLSTARDMAKLSVSLLRHFPHHYHFFSVERFRYKGRTYSNHNKLLDDYPGVDGLKTGYIRASGFNLAASAVRGGQRIVAVVYGGRTSRSRNAHMVKLLNEGFSRLRLARSEAPDGPPPPKPVALAGAAPAPAPTTLSQDRIDTIETVLAALESGEIAATAPQAQPDDGSFTELAETYGVQVGAFSERNRARSAALTAAQRASGLLDGHTIRVSQIQDERGTLYRARLLGLSEWRAKEACEVLKSQRTACVVVQADRLDVALKQ